MIDEDVRIVRGLVARVREEQPALEPSPAITAQLLLAARAHAPRRATSWTRARAFLLPATALAAAAVVLLIGTRRGDDPAPAPARAPERPAEVERAKAAGVTATMRPVEAELEAARAAAARNDCAEVQRIVDALRTRDASYHDATVAPDPALAACLRARDRAPAAP